MRTPLTSIGDLLFGQTRGRVLALLYGAPDETFFVRQIARQVEASMGTVQRWVRKIKSHSQKRNTTS